MDQKGHVSTIINDEVASVTLVINRPGDGVQGALPVLLEGLSLPGENGSRSITGDGGSSVVLSGEDVARTPTDVGTHGLEGLDKHGSLDGHVQRARDASTLEKSVPYSLRQAIRPGISCSAIVISLRPKSANAKEEMMVRMDTRRFFGVRVIPRCQKAIKRTTLENLECAAYFTYQQAKYQQRGNLQRPSLTQQN